MFAHVALRATYTSCTYSCRGERVDGERLPVYTGRNRSAWRPRSHVHRRVVAPNAAAWSTVGLRARRRDRTEVCDVELSNHRACQPSW